MIKTQLVGIGGQGHKARVNHAGSIQTTVFDFSIPVFKELGEDNVPQTFVIPKPNNHIVITDLILYANKNVGAGDAVVEIYEATGTGVTAVSRIIYKMELPQKTVVPLVGLNWITNPGKFLNGKTDDDDVFITVGCYYHPVDEANVAITIQ